MTTHAALIPRDKFNNGNEQELLNDWEWDVEFGAMAQRRIERLESCKHSRFELYEELIQLMLELEIYWSGLSEERQRASAKTVREILRRCEARKARVQDWAASELRKRMRETGRIPIAEWDEVCREDM